MIDDRARTILFFGGGFVGLILATVGSSLGFIWSFPILLAGWGTAGWVLSGSTVLEALSWTIPLFFWELGAFLLPWPWSLVPSLIGVGFLAAMLGAVTTPLPEFWYRRVLRRRPPFR
jgi:hypothetical protein